MIAPNKNRRHLFALSLLIIALVAVYVGMNSDSTEQAEKDTAPTTQEFDRSAHSIDDPDSLWVIVNKQRPIPHDYAPNLTVPDIPLYGPRDAENMQVDARIEDDLKRLVEAARAAGHEAALGSGYRSASYQEGIYNLYVEREGQTAADRFSARPGHSEHQTGLAVDFVTPNGECFIEECFEDTPLGQWLQKNAYKYGFILRYQKGKQDVTGYNYEPWHFRYVGTALATELHNQGNPTLEGFFNLAPAGNY